MALTPINILTDKWTDLVDVVNEAVDVLNNQVVIADGQPVNGSLNLTGDLVANTVNAPVGIFTNTTSTTSSANTATANTVSANTVTSVNVNGTNANLVNITSSNTNVNTLQANNSTLETVTANTVSIKDTISGNVSSFVVNGSTANNKFLVANTASNRLMYYQPSTSDLSDFSTYDQIVDQRISDSVSILGEFRNKIINPLFNINQRGVTGTVVLTAGQYGHDRFKAGSSGCTYTFSTSGFGVTTINITSGELHQIVEGSVFSGAGGDHILTWTGTAEGRINTTGAWGASGRVANLLGSANATLMWRNGTLSLPQLEKGYATSFSSRHIQQELALCRRYFQGLQSVRLRFDAYKTSQEMSIMERFEPMRTTPSIATSAVQSVNLISQTLTAYTSTYNTLMYVVVGNAIGGVDGLLYYTLDAEL